MDELNFLAAEFKLRSEHVKNIIELIDSGATIPFIARYRKELTGSCDDQVLRELSEKLVYIRNLDKRKKEVFSSISDQGKMTDEISASLEKASVLSEVEDIYRPYKPKRRTKATIAEGKGLAPLAVKILAQDEFTGELSSFASVFIDEEKGVMSSEEALSGAGDIIAEIISDNAEARSILRGDAKKSGMVVSRAAGENDSVYRLYYDFTESFEKIPSHRILALNRGEKEDFLKVSISCDKSNAISLLEKLFIKNDSISRDLIAICIADAYSRLIWPSLERELRQELTERASEQAISLFGMNLKNLLLVPPIKGKTVFAIDPGMRTGCKIAVIDPTGKLLETSVFYPTPPYNKIEESKAVLFRFLDKYAVDAIAIGNGTASKESEIFVSGCLKEYSRKNIGYMMVSEAGASVYSASKLGASEFPDFDVSLRSAVSIGRRMQDPLAELVKIDPKAVGVGQYQHDMPEAKLSETLDGVVEDCVNAVGVDLNTASSALLARVSGLNATAAANIVKYRDENGAFAKRSQLKKVPRMGAKTFEQCAGFLRIPGAVNYLDSTGVHPESYEGAQKLISFLGIDVNDPVSLSLLPYHITQHGESKLSELTGLGIPTLRDVVKELIKPGRDLRDELPPPELRTDVLGIESLVPGMIFRGTVRNVVDFGAFIDIGVHQDGLVHVSRISDRRIAHPSDALKIGDIVNVRILSVDIEKKRISLTMRPSELNA